MPCDTKAEHCTATFVLGSSLSVPVHDSTRQYIPQAAEAASTFTVKLTFEFLWHDLAPGACARRYLPFG